MLKLILFDIDGTLLRGEGIGREAKSRAMKIIYGTDGTVLTLPFGGKTDLQIMTESLLETDITVEYMKSRMPEYEGIMAEQLTAIVAEKPPVPCPGAMELVNELRESDSVLLGIITGNMGKTAAVKLSGAGFDPAWFAFGAYGHESHDRNDLSRLAVQRAVEHSKQNFSPEDIVIIGDTVADIQCARAVRAVSVAVLTGFEPEENLRAEKPNYILNDLREFRTTGLLD